MPKCEKCGKSMKSNTERLPGLDIDIRIWECSCGFKRNLVREGEHDKWEETKRVKSKVPVKSNYNYLDCLDKPDKNEKDSKKKTDCGCGGDCGDACTCNDKPDCSGGCGGCK